MKKVFFLLVIAILVTVVGGYFYLEEKSLNSRSSSSNLLQEFEIASGEGAQEVGVRLEEEGLILNKSFFYYYLWKTDQNNKLQAGVYEISPSMTIPEMVEKFTRGKVKEKVVKITVPEGFTNEKIIKLVKEREPSIADEFEEIVTCKCLGQAECECDRFSQKYDFLAQIPKGVDMEGYLFPDTYFISPEETGSTLVSKFLNNFKKKYSEDFVAQMEKRDKSYHEIMTMASIIEREVRTDEDRKVVSGIFWNRVEDSYPLQSCATLAYFLGVDKPQFSYEDTQIESPYNTYVNAGMPPGPISNPGLPSIEAALYPEETDYYFFLSDAETGEIIYSETLEEHNANKDRHGL